MCGLSKEFVFRMNSHFCSFKMVFLSMRSLLVVALLQPNVYSVLAQSLSGTWQYPLQALTVNNIDTVILQWTSNYTKLSWMNVWCNNDGAQILGE